MSSRRPAPVSAAPRRRLRKILVFVLLGVVLGVLTVLFLARVHNPFEEGIGDRQLLVLAPADADLLVFIPRVPRFLGDLRDRVFSRELAENRRFQQFLRSDYARKTGAVEALSSAFRELDLLRARPPFGLDLWQDISGEALLFAGYAPASAGQPWQFIAMFRPNSWKVLAGVNVLVDPVLGGLSPIRSALDASGVKSVDRYRDSVKLTFSQGVAISLARIRNVVVVGTETERVTRLKTAIERDRIPVSPSPRFAELAADTIGTGNEARAIVRRRVADAQLQLADRLERQWGRDNVSLLQATLPRFTGEDLFVALSVDQALDLRLRMAEGSPVQNDIGRSLKPQPREDASLAFQRAAPLLPESTFAFVHVKVDVMQFLDAFFQRAELFKAADFTNIADALRPIPEIGDLAGLKNKLAEICDGPASIGFFKQDRDHLDKAAPGYFVAFHVQNDQELRKTLDAVARRVREGGQAGKRSGIRDMVHDQRGGTDLYEIVLPEGVVDDARVTKLGLVVGREVLIVTNYIPSFRPVMQTTSIDHRVLPAEPVLVGALENGPDVIRAACAISGDAIYQYFDQAAPGWAVQQTTPSARTESAWNAAASIEARTRGLKDGTAEFAKYVDDAYQRELDKVIKIDRPRIRGEIDRYLEYFRGLVRSIGLFIGERDGIEIAARIELNGAQP